VPFADRIVPLSRVSLAPLGTLGIGGVARWFLRAGRIEDVVAAHQWSDEQGVPMFVLGGGSNLVVADEGFDGLVLQMGISGTSIVRDAGDTVLKAGAGEAWDNVVEAVVARGLAGVECLSGIPGTVGGTPIQNVGAYGQEVATSIDRVTVYDVFERRVVSLGAGECLFAYRMSRFKGQDAGRFVVCEVTFRLRSGPPTSTYADVAGYLKRANVSSPTVATIRAAVLAIRRSKGMVVDAADPDSRSVGSFFMNPVVAMADVERVAAVARDRPPTFPMDGARVKIPAAWMIERAGFAKGYADGAVGISTKHTLALVNRGGATARDVLRLAVAVKRAVAERFGVWLRTEPVFVGFRSDRDVDYLTKARD
jgi:UDP-N-acetylmuramate dehydrogenase